MTNIELLKPSPKQGDLISKSAHTLAGLQELEALLEEIRDAMRGVDRSSINAPVVDKGPSGLLDVEDCKGRYLARCHVLASEIRAIIL